MRYKQMPSTTFNTLSSPLSSLLHLLTYWTLTLKAPSETYLALCALRSGSVSAPSFVWFSRSRSFTLKSITMPFPLVHVQGPRMAQVCCLLQHWQSCRDIPIQVLAMALVTCWLEVHPASLPRNQASRHRLLKLQAHQEVVPLRVPLILMNMVRVFVMISHWQTFTDVDTVPVYDGREGKFNMRQLHILNRSLNA